MSIDARFFCPFVDTCGMKGDEDCGECLSFHRVVLSFESLFHESAPLVEKKEKVA